MSARAQKIARGSARIDVPMKPSAETIPYPVPCIKPTCAFYGKMGWISLNICGNALRIWLRSTRKSDGARSLKSEKPWILLAGPSYSVFVEKADGQRLSDPIGSHKSKII